MLFTQAFLKHKPLFLVISALLTAVFCSGVVFKTDAFAAADTSTWFRMTGTAVTEENIWELNGVEPDVGVAVAFAYAITTDNGLSGGLDGTWDCGKNAIASHQKPIDNFAMLIKTDNYYVDEAVDSVFPGVKAKDFEIAAANIIATTINSYGAIDNDNKSRCTFVADEMGKNGLISESAEQSRVDLADIIATECGPVWSKGMDGAEAISYYNVLLMSFGSKDWEEKIVKPYEANSGADRCTAIDDASKITSLSPAKLKEELEKACKDNAAQLNEIKSFSNIQIAKAYSKIKDGKSCKDAVSFASTDGGSGVDPPEDAQTSCAIDGIGWIICPVMNFLADVNEKAFDFLQSLLGIRPSLVQDKNTVEAWSKFRDFANIAFVIAFMVIIYSQVTSVGISNYGIKRLLPKIAVAAIMVNLSLFFCQILVDLSNIAGASLYSFMKDLVPIAQGTGDDSTWTGIMSTVLAAGVGVLLVVLIITAPTVLLALGLILLILVARQAFILILVIISPLAFVAYLLPNTENLFKKWWKALTATLLVYPIIAVVFGASTLASNILMGIASSKGNISGSDDNQMLAIVALAVMAVPLFAVPVILKGAMSAAGNIGAKLQGMADKSQSRATAKMGQKVKTRGERYGNQIKAGAVGLGSKVSNSDKFGRALGSKNSFRRRKLGALASLGATSAVDNAEKDKYAKVAADAAARNYVADTASHSASYARSLAGGRLAPGSADMAKFVQSYALQEKEAEFEKDVKAAQVFEQNARRTKEELHRRVADGSLAIHERVAAMRQFKEVANADETQKMVETLAGIGGLATAPGATEETQEHSQKIMSEFDRAFAGSSLVPASVSGTDRGNMRNGIFSMTRDQRIKRDLEGDAKGSKVGSDYILKMDVDEMHEWADDADAISTLKSLAPDAKLRFIEAIEEAANDDIKGNQFEARQIEQLKKIAGHLGGSVAVTNTKYAKKWI